MKWSWLLEKCFGPLSEVVGMLALVNESVYQLGLKPKFYEIVKKKKISGK